MYIVAMEIDDHELYLFVKEPLQLSCTLQQMDILHREIENFGLCFKKEVNQKKEIERKTAIPSFLTKSKKLIKYFLWWLKIYHYMIFFFYFLSWHIIHSSFKQLHHFHFQVLFGNCEIVPKGPWTLKQTNSFFVSVCMTFCYQPAWKGYICWHYLLEK